MDYRTKIRINYDCGVTNFGGERNVSGGYQLHQLSSQQAL
jgi:hypothetical protein